MAQTSIRLGPAAGYEPASTTACSGAHQAPSPGSIRTQTSPPLTGSRESTSVGSSSIAPIPSASIAHMAYISGLPSIEMRCGVGRPEKG